MRPPHRWKQYGSWSPHAWYPSSPTEEKQLETYQKREEKTKPDARQHHKKNPDGIHIDPKGSTIYRNRAARHRKYRWQKQNIHGRKTRKNSNKLLDEITNQYTPGGWKEYLKETKIKYDITENTDEDDDNNTSTKEKILKAFKTRIEKEGENKSKIKSPRGPPRMNPGTAETLHASTRKNAGKYHI